MQQLGGELGAARAEVLELKEGRNVALVVAVQAGKERNAAVVAITLARGKLDDVAAVTACSRKEVDNVGRARHRDGGGRTGASIAR